MIIITNPFPSESPWWYAVAALRKPDEFTGWGIYDVVDALGTFGHNIAVAGAIAEVRQRAYREGYAHGKDYYE